MVIVILGHGGGRNHIRTRRWSLSYKDTEVVVIILGHGGGRSHFRTRRWS